MSNQKYKEMLSRYFRGQLANSEYELLLKSLHYKTNRESFENAKIEWENEPQLDELGIRNMNRLSFQINKPDTTLYKPIVRRLWVQIASVAAILLFGFFWGAP